MKINKLKIHGSFILFMILLIALGHIKQFLLLVFATTLHELCHVIMSKIFGLKISSFIITPIGEVACIEGLDSLKSSKRSAVLLAGPMSNFISALLVYVLFGRASYYADQFITISLAIGFFNMLPIYPMDGGKLLHIGLGNKFGILNSIKHIKLLSRVGIAAVFISGILQICLFPFNFSLVAIASFLFTIYKKESASMVFSYYKFMMNKEIPKGGLPVKAAVCSKDTTLSEMQNVFTWDYFHIIHIIDGNGIEKSLTEREIFEELVNFSVDISDA